MSNIPFDPYYKWLAIRPEEQPPNHYRLLGVALFESDLDVLSTAADQRMAHVRSFQNGPHAAVSQAVLNEIAAARLCLLSAERKAKYDQALQKATSVMPTSLSLERPTPSPSAIDNVASGPLDTEPVGLPATRTVRKESRSFSRVAVIAGVSAILLASVVTLMSRGGHSPETKQAVASPAAVEPPAVEAPVVASKEERQAPVKPPERPAVEPPRLEAIERKPVEIAQPVAQSEPVQVALAEKRTKEESRPAHEQAQDWIDLLAKIDPARDRVQGEWRKDDEGLTSAEGEFVRVVSPVVVNGSYDLKATFTRNKGNNAIGFVLPVGDRACAVILSGWNGAICGIEMIEGKASNANPTTNRSAKIANGKQYALLAKARLRRPLVSIEVYLDDVLIMQWQGNESALSLYGAWRLPQTGRVGFGSHQPTTFHSARIKMVADKPLSSEEDKSAEPAPGNALPRPARAKAVRQADEASSSTKAAATKEPPEDAAAPLTKKELVSAANVLKKKLHGRVFYDRKAEQFVLTYDWTNKLQLDDFKTKAKLNFTRGKLVLQAGESVGFIVPFKEVTISTAVLVAQMKGTMIKTSGGAHARVGGAYVDTIYLDSGEGDRPELVVPKPQRTGVQPVQLTVTEHRLGFAYGIGEPSKIGKAVSNFYAGKVMLFGGEMGYQYGKLVLTGTIDDRWLKSLEEE